MTTVVTLGMARLPGETVSDSASVRKRRHRQRSAKRSGSRVLPLSSTAHGRAPLMTGDAALDRSSPVRRDGHYFTSTLTWVGLVMMS